MKATDLPLLSTPGRPSIHPTEDVAVVSVTRPDLGADAYVGQLWSVRLDGGTPRRLTRGFRDTAPQYSPDGSLIAFLRAAPGESPQLHVVAAVGGEPVAVTDELLGISDIAWSPDSTRLAYTARVAEQGRYGSVQEIGPAAEAPRRFTTRTYRANGVGYTTDRRAALFLVDVPDVSAEPAVQPVPERSGEKPETVVTVPLATRLTNVDADVSHPVFTPDGSAVAFVASLHETADTDRVSDVFRVDIDGAGEPRRISSGDARRSIAVAAFSPDGILHVLAQEVGESGRDFVARNTSLYRMATPDDPADVLTDVADTDLGEVSEIAFTSDGSIVVLNRVRGAVRAERLEADGSRVLLTSDTDVVSSIAASGERIVGVVAGASDAGEVAVLGGESPVVLTDFSAGLRDAGVLPVERHSITGRSGQIIEGWLVKPRGAGPFPTLLMIHGGPFAAYTGALFDESQVYADAGYAVVYCNPRGAAGFGEAFGRSIKNAMGTVDHEDVIDFFDGVLAADGSLDADRVGILGGSYGGYLTAWITGHDHRFAGAIVERGFLDPELFVGTSDIGDFFGDEYVGTSAEDIARQSPQAHVGSVTTPTLVLHSADDLRCPLSQAERYYAALKRNGVDAELVVFPGENHELSRAGRPRHRQDRFDVILDWWARVLPV
ncbi:S9 family peptidase [Labedella endophytica]|uniref:S9 family peptidase n=1 Tax=Labedella endophytica TaxID=1523160 RepID=A0A3S0VD85_9MICO|nr:S9 family peptidase [Labedella endophytica]RUQ97105.1 S9 family peptidase [Labedella endophytica]